MVGEYIDDGWSGTTFERLNFKRMMVQVKSILKDETYIGNKVIVNYRPILIAGQLEASYPSSTTMLAICVLSTAAMQLRDLLVRPVLRRWGVAGLAFFMVIGRLLSGVHWLSDIIGGVLLSGGLVLLYAGISRN